MEVITNNFAVSDLESKALMARHVMSRWWSAPFTDLNRKVVPCRGLPEMTYWLLLLSDTVPPSRSHSTLGRGFPRALQKKYVLSPAMTLWSRGPKIMVGASEKKRVDRRLEYFHYYKENIALYPQKWGIESSFWKLSLDRLHAKKQKIWYCVRMLGTELTLHIE